MRFFQQKRQSHLSSSLAITVISATLLTLSACGDSDNDDNISNNDATYDITVYNLDRKSVV